MAFEDCLFSEICECHWCGAETLYVKANWCNAPDEPGEDIITLLVQCLNEECKFKNYGCGMRIEKE